MVLSSVRLKLVAVPADQLHQLGVNKEFFFAKWHFAQHAQRGQVMQVARGGLALGHAFIHQFAAADRG